MIKLEFEEFIEEIKAEMYGYEEIEEEMINQWESKFRLYVNKSKGNKKTSDKIKFKNNGIVIELKDETDIFNIVDKFLAAVVNEEIDKYWTDWSL